MKTKRILTVLSLATSLAACLPFTAHAHRGWLLPSSTVLSGSDNWVSVDAAVSNDLFYFEHNALRLDGLTITAPDGTSLKAENTASGRYRNSFDLKLAHKGTYRLALVNDALMASYKLNGETKRWRGTAEGFAKEVPANAEGLSVTRAQSRVETFVTAGQPSEQVLKPTNTGLELVYLTHPNDLAAGDTARFRFLLDGKPAPNLTVHVVPGGVRYRNKLNEMRLTTDAEGAVSVTWPEAGMYWINASAGGGRPQAGAPAQPAGTLAAPQRRASYAATLEVLPQ
jgi:uncharacterized GH25 family protein